MVKIAFIHPELVIGGAERLVVDAALGLKRKGHQVDIFTSYHDKNHCFTETADGTLNVIVKGDKIPRDFKKKGHVLFALVKSWYLAICVVLRFWLFNEKYDLFFVDQVSACIPILKLAGINVLFYCHFPDQLLTKRNSLLKSIYRKPFDFIEEFTTSIMTLI